MLPMRLELIISSLQDWCLTTMALEAQNYGNLESQRRRCFGTRRCFGRRRCFGTRIVSFEDTSYTTDLYPYKKYKQVRLPEIESGSTAW